MSLLGCPIVGDRRYWRKTLPWPAELEQAYEQKQQQRQQRQQQRQQRQQAEAHAGGAAAEEEEEAQLLLLSAVRLELPHPETGESLCVRVDQPAGFERFCLASAREGATEHAHASSLFRSLDS